MPPPPPPQQQQQDFLPLSEPMEWLYDWEYLWDGVTVSQPLFCECSSCTDTFTDGHHG